MAFVECVIRSAGYDVIYVANSTQTIIKIEDGADCIANAPTVTKSGWTFLGWREDTQANPNVLPSKICDQDNIILYAVWKQIGTVIHGSYVTHSAGYWGYDVDANGAGYNWSNGAGGTCDGRCGISGCGVTGGIVWQGSGYNTPNGDGTYTPHPDWHGELSGTWTRSETRTIYSNG